MHILERVTEKNIEEIKIYRFLYFTLGIRGVL